MLQIRGTELDNSIESLQLVCVRTRACVCVCVPLLQPPVCVRVRLRGVVIHTCVTKPANTLQSLSYTSYRILYTYLVFR